MEIIHKGTPKVSLGMPVYNGEKYIQEALDSLLTQTFTDFELIISDNASTDNTSVICQGYAKNDLRIRYIRQDQNKGAIANFKFVLDEAVGEYFMWVAYDDLWAPDFLMDATALLLDKNINFVFPTFELRSIRLGLAKKFSPEIFRFIESSDRKWRILHFMALHYLSFSVNIVYSLFKKEFLQTVWSIQNISNEGAMGTIVLSLSRGVMSNSLFSKRYKVIWPGMLPSWLIVLKGMCYKRDVIHNAKKAIEDFRVYMLSAFPEFETEIQYIYIKYRPFVYDRYYRICSLENILVKCCE